MVSMAGMLVTRMWKRCHAGDDGDVDLGMSENQNRCCHSRVDPPECGNIGR